MDMRTFARLLVLAALLALVVPFEASAQSVPARPTSTEASTGTSGATQEGFLLADKVYAKPDAFSEEVTTIGRDDKVRVTPIAGSNGWYQVYKSGTTERAGFVFRPYVSRFGSGGLASFDPSSDPRATDSEKLNEVTFAEVPADAGVRCTVQTWSNVRSGPGMSNEAFGVIRPEVPFQVLSIENGWGKIRLKGTHAFGYVSGALLHRVAEPVADASDEERAAQPAADQDAAVPEDAEERAQEAAIRHALDSLPVDAETMVYVTRTGRKFHRADCRHLRSRTFAIPLTEAMMDYAPCRTCKPLIPRDEDEDGDSE